MTLTDELQDLVEHTPEGVKTISVEVDWLRRELDRETAENGNGDQSGSGQYLTTREAAERLSVQPETVARWCRKGRFPNALKTENEAGTGEWRIPIEDIGRLQEREGERDRVHFERN